MIEICYALTDKTGNYWKQTATSILSVIMNTDNKVRFHILTDSSLSSIAIEVMQYIVKKYDCYIEFYNVEQFPCWNLLKNVHADNLKKMTLATFYRLWILAIIPKYVRRIIYLDSDVISNLDIKLLWQQKLEKGIGAVVDTVIAADVSNDQIPMCEDGSVEANKYFNAGVLLLDRKYFSSDYKVIEKQFIDFFNKYPQVFYLDQDFLNYYYNENYTELLYRFNTMINLERFYNSYDVEPRIYHYVNHSFEQQLDDCYGILYKKYADIIEELAK